MHLKQCLKLVSSTVTNALERGFERYGFLTYKYPWAIGILSFLVLASLAYGFTLYEEELDADKLWVPKDAQALADAEQISKAFNLHFRVEEVFVLSKSQGANLLTTEVFDELMQFEQGMWSSVEYQGKKYNDICYRALSSSSNESGCYTSMYPLQFFLQEDATFNRTMLSDLLAEINDGKGTTDFYPADSANYINIDGMFGGVTPQGATSSTSDGTNNIQEAKAVHWRFYVDTQTISIEFLDKFEQNYEAYVEEFNANSIYISVHPLLRFSIRRQSDDAIQEDVQLVSIGIMCVAIYSVFVMAELNTYRSRILIGLASLLSIAVAYIEAIGLGAFLEIKGNSYVGVLPFLMVGIGVDDAYVLISAVKQAPNEANGEEIMKYMMKHAGVSVTVTSLTNIGAFGIGAVTSIPAIRNFCLYAAFGMLFDYFNQITLFSALLAYDIRRSQRPLGDCCGLLFCKPDSCCGGQCIYDQNGNTKESFSHQLVSKVYSKCLIKTPIRIAVCICFAGLLAVNIYGVTQLTPHFKHEWLVNEEFPVHSSLEIRDEYFKDLGQAVDFFSLHSEFASQKVQSRLETLADNIDSCYECRKDWIIPKSTQSWYASFKNWVDQEQCQDSTGAIVRLDNEYVPETEFYHCLALFEQTSDGVGYSSKLAWEASVLIGAGLTADLVSIETDFEESSVLEDTRRIADTGPDLTYVYNEHYPSYETSRVFAQECQIQLGSAIALGLVTLLITDAEVLLALLVLLMVACTVIGQLGTLALWGEHLNVLSMTNSIMAIGVALDYSAHIAHAYKYGRETDRRKRATHALRRIGVSIFNGGVSTFIAILPLVAAQTYPLKLFMKCWLPIIVYGLAHALVLLPVLLSFIGVTLAQSSSEIEFNTVGTVKKTEGREAVDSKDSQQR